MLVAALVGLAADQADAIQAAAAAAADGVEPWADLRGSTEYKQDLIRGLTGRAVRSALDRALVGTAEGSSR